MTSTPIDTLAPALAADLDRSFPDLVRLLQDDLFSGALRMTGNRSDAEDIAQESFVRAYRALSGYPKARIEALQVRGWIWTITMNLCRNRARSRSRKPEAAFPEEFDPASRAVGPEEAVLDLIGNARLADHVAALSWAQRQGVVLRHVVGLSYAEISDVVQRPVGTVKADVHRALARLREVVPEEAP